MSETQDVLSSELFRELAEASAAITFIYQGEKNIYANPAAEAATGYSRAELANLRFWEIIHPDSQAVVRERGLARQRGESVPPNYEVQIVTKSGDTRWLEFTGKVVDLDGQVAILGTAFDVTERRRSRAALAKSEAVYRRLVDGALVGVLRTNLSGRILYANRATLALFGFQSIEELQADGMLARYEFPEERELLLKSLRERGVVEQFEVSFVRGDGAAVRVACSVVLEDDVLSGVLVDVTERRRLEREALRVQKLDSLALLAGGLAHDFNNFMAAILNNLTLAQREELPAAAISFLGEAERAVLRARGLTDQLLTFARGGAGDDRTERTDTAALLREAVSFALRGSQVDCLWDLPTPLPAIDVDPGQIAQVVHNLVLNAIQAMPRGGTLRVSAKRLVTEEGERLVVAFQDEGAGIPLDDLPRVFDPYFTTKQKGSGLGLAAADAIVRRHLGALRIESAPGAGTTVLLELPAAGAEAPASSAPPSRARPDAPKGSSILVLDDDEAVLRSTCALLNELGYQTTPVRDGTQALEAFTREDHDLLLLDLTIPGGVGGVQVLEQLRRSGTETPAILVTGYASEASLESHAALDVEAVLRKPFTLDDLASCIASALGT